MFASSSRLLNVSVVILQNVFFPPVRNILQYSERAKNICASSVYEYVPRNCEFFAYKLHLRRGVEKQTGSS